MRWLIKKNRIQNETRGFLLDIYRAPDINISITVIANNVNGGSIKEVDKSME
jgi:uncharacterized protein (DUF1919 family)